nr:flavin reductase family protein [Cobetia sp.]
MRRWSPSASRQAPSATRRFARQSASLSISSPASKAMSLTSSPCVGVDKWQGIDWQLSPLGNPVINDSLHWLDCKIHAEHPVGDHLIVIGEVKGLNLDVGATARPLLYFKGKYGGLAGGG